MHDAEIGVWRFDPGEDKYYFTSPISLGYVGSTRVVPADQIKQLQHRADALVERLSREGGSADAETRYWHADGHWAHLRVHIHSGSRVALGRYELFGITQDVTRQAVARDEAKTYAERLRLALKAARGAVFEYNYRKKTFWASDEIVAMHRPRPPQRAWRSAAGAFRRGRSRDGPGDGARHGTRRRGRLRRRPPADHRRHPMGTALYRGGARFDRQTAASDRPVHRHRRAEEAGIGIARGAPRRRIGRTGEVELPRIDEPRDPDAAQRRARHGAVAAHRSADAGPAREGRDHPRFRQYADGAAERRARPVQDRGRQAGDRQCRGQHPRRHRADHQPVPAERRGKEHHARPCDRPAPAPAAVLRSGARPAMRQQSALQRHQVHRARRRDRDAAEVPRADRWQPYR